jgi:hypothetical protein
MANEIGRRTTLKTAMVIAKMTGAMITRGDGIDLDLRLVHTNARGKKGGDHTLGHALETGGKKAGSVPDREAGAEAREGRRSLVPRVARGRGIGIGIGERRIVRGRETRRGRGGRIRAVPAHAHARGQDPGRGIGTERKIRRARRRRRRRFVLFTHDVGQGFSTPDRNRRHHLLLKSGESMVLSMRLSTCSILSFFTDTVDVIFYPLPFKLLSSTLTPPHSIYNKEAEFRTWLVEERMVNPETISKDQTKTEFAKFVEDFNTGSSLPPLNIFELTHIIS